MVGGVLRCVSSVVPPPAGKALQLHLQACDVKGKEEKSGPENMLTEPSTGDGTSRALSPESIHMEATRPPIDLRLKVLSFLPLCDPVDVRRSLCSSAGFLTETGRKRASVILSTEDQSTFQVTQMKIKVSRSFDSLPGSARA